MQFKFGGSLKLTVFGTGVDVSFEVNPSKPAWRARLPAACLPVFLSVCLASLPASLPACMPACVPACLPVYLSVGRPARMHACP